MNDFNTLKGMFVFMILFFMRGFIKHLFQFFLNFGLPFFQLLMSVAYFVFLLNLFLNSIYRILS